MGDNGNKSGDQAPPPPKPSDNPSKEIQRDKPIEDLETR